jgi:hypothetical protein
MSEIANNPNGGINQTTDWTKGLINDFPVFLNTSSPVVCKDGTKKMQPSSPNARYMDVCRDNGGVDNQKTNDNAKKLREDAFAKSNEDALAKANENSQTQKPRTFIEMNQGYIIIGLVLVAGYFAYKKFKK